MEEAGRPVEPQMSLLQQLLSEWHSELTDMWFKRRRRNRRNLSPRWFCNGPMWPYSARVLSRRFSGYWDRASYWLFLFSFWFFLLWKVGTLKIAVIDRVYSLKFLVFFCEPLMFHYPSAEFMRKDERPPPPPSYLKVKRKKNERKKVPLRYLNKEKKTAGRWNVGNILLFERKNGSLWNGRRKYSTTL